MIRSLPDGWTTAQLGDLVAVLDAQRVPVNAAERAKRPGAVPYYGATGQVGWIDEHLFDEELVLLGEDGAPFLDPAKPKAYLIHGKSWVNNHAHVLRTLGGMPSSFLKYQLDSVDYRDFISGTTRFKLPQAPMRRIPLAVPPLPEQERISAELDSYFSRLDDASIGLERVERNLKRYRASVLQAAVEGRLVPTEAELARAEGRDYEPASELLKRILTERRRRWEETELARLKSKGKASTDDRWKEKYKEPVALDAKERPHLPPGWCWATLDQISWDSSYGTSAKCSEKGLGEPVIRIPNIVDGSIQVDSLKYANRCLDIAEENALAPGDLLVIRTNGSRNLIGRGALVSQPLSSAHYFASYLIRFRLTSKDLGSWILSLWHAPATRLELEAAAATSAGQYNISQTALRHQAVPLPPLAEQARIQVEVDRLSSIHRDASISVSNACTRVQRLRQGVLSWAFQGKLADQDPADEPASELLKRIRKARDTVRPAGKGTRRIRRKRA